MTLIWLIPFLLQGIIMGVDEFHYHRERGLPPWERIGHPIDTFLFVLCLAFTLIASPGTSMLKIYAGLAALSCVVITKDEFIHTELCSKTENWLHALLFVLHPVVLIEVGAIWAGVGSPPALGRAIIPGECLLVWIFLAYQIIFWWGPCHERQQRVLRSAR